MYSIDFLVNSKGVVVKNSRGEQIKYSEFGGVLHGSKIFIKNNTDEILEYFYNQISQRPCCFVRQFDSRGAAWTTKKQTQGEQLELDRIGLSMGAGTHARTQARRDKQDQELVRHSE